MARTSILALVGGCALSIAANVALASCGGAPPLCYPTDVTDQMVQRWKNQHQAPTVAQNSAAPNAITQTDMIKTTVKQCVDFVHALPHGSDPVMSNFYREFDAYYNPADGKVYNNATRVGDQQPLFAFRKCMTEQGMPLQ